MDIVTKPNPSGDPPKDPEIDLLHTTKQQNYTQNSNRNQNGADDEMNTTQRDSAPKSAVNTLDDCRTRCVE